jgi:hypothetical protein
MGRRLDAVLGWMDRLDEATLGRFGRLPHQVAQRNKPLPHPVLLVVGGFSFAFTLNMIIYFVAFDRPLGTSLLMSCLIGLGPVLPIAIRTFLQQRQPPKPEIQGSE